MPEAPSISVIIPVYNGARFLGEALQSVDDQTLRPLEVLVVDDGSTDGSAGIAESRPGVRCLRMAHRGVSAARNLAVREARGEWLAFLDADDRWLPERLQVQVAASRDLPQTAIFLGLKRILVESPAPAWYDGPPTGAEIPSYEPSVWLVRREAFGVAGDFDTTKTRGEDVEWLSRAADCGLAMHVCERVLVERRIHSENVSAAHFDRKSLMLEILRESVGRKRARAGGQP